MRRLRPLLLLMFVPAACSSSPDGRAERNCVLSAADSTFVGAQPLFPACGVDRAARAVRTAVEIGPNALPARGEACYVAEVQFVVGVDGRPEPNTVRVVSGAGTFANLVAASVPQWQYTPAERAGIAVRQVVRERKVMATVVTVSAAGSAPSRPPAPTNCR